MNNQPSNQTIGWLNLIEKMKKLIITNILIVFTLKNFAQNKTFVKDNLIRLNVLTPGITYEKGISKIQTLCLDANLSLVPTTSDETGLAKTVFFRLQYRNYYNLNKRLEMSKNINNNSGNYYAINSSYYFKSISDNDFININDGLSVGVVWGLQRTYKNGININLNTGMGYVFSSRKSKTLSPITPIINFTVGWVLF